MLFRSFHAVYSQWLTSNMVTPCLVLAPDCSKTRLLTPEEMLHAAGEDSAGESKSDEHPKGNSKVSLRVHHLDIIGERLLPQ